MPFKEKRRSIMFEKSDPIFERAEALAQHHELGSLAQAVRWAVNQQYQQLPETTPTQVPKKKSRKKVG